MIPSICIVGGCGHVGLPLGLAFVRAGADVTLIDIDAARVKFVGEGNMPFVERGADVALPEAIRSGRLHLTTDQDAISRAEVAVITIGTPIDEFLNPSIREFDAALDGVIARLHAGQLLVLRSTVFPGVTERLARRIATERPGVDIAYCPERIAQGFALAEITKLPQIVGGCSPVANDRAADLFRALGVRILTVSPLEAELAKLFTNSYRYITFAAANQFYLLAQRFGADFARVRDAVVTDYPRMAGFPKSGFAGGPCLLKDTMQLAAFDQGSFLLGQAAMMINEGLPAALVERVKASHPLRGLTAGILGMAFKGNDDDHRASLAYKLRKILHLECEKVLCTDPYIKDPEFVSLDRCLAESDILFVGACHDEYRGLRTDKPLVDVFGFISTADRPTVVS
jgi:UDP-N-acetyl-D-mannosaminuronic acid dehydrogenase